MPIVTVTSGYGIHMVGAVIDHQMQRHRAVRTVLVLVDCVVSPCFGKCSSIPIVTVAGGCREYVGGGVVYCQVQGIHLQATVAVIVTAIVGS